MATAKRTKLEFKGTDRHVVIAADAVQTVEIYNGVDYMGRMRAGKTMSGAKKTLWRVRVNGICVYEGYSARTAQSIYRKAAACVE